MNGKIIRSFEQLVGDVMRAYHAPGLAAAVIDRAGNTVYSRCFGWRDEEECLPVTENTIFGMASLTKSFTAMATLQLCEKGVLSLDMPVKQYLPALQDDTILVRHLLDHTAGFYPLPRMQIAAVAKDLGIFGNGTAELAENRELAEEGGKRVIERLNAVRRRLGRPGEYMSYCNDGYGLLSELIRLFGGEPSYPAYLKKYIFAPLGMDRSSCDFVSPFSDSDHTSLYLDVDGVHTKRNSFYDNAFVLHGGGAIRSTLNDLKKYLAMLLNGSGVCMSAGIYGELTQPGPDYDYRSRYCKGFCTFTMKGKAVFAHSGGLTGISNRLIWSPEMGVGAILLCNKSLVPIATVGNAAMQAFGLHEAVALPRPVKPCRVSDLQGKPEDILGEYLSGEGTYVKLYQGENGMLRAVTDKLTDLPVEVTDNGVLAVNRPCDTRYIIPMILSNGDRAIHFGGRTFPKCSE